MISKLHVKVGEIELDYEGEEEFLREEILPLLNVLRNSKNNVDNTSPTEPDSKKGDGSFEFPIHGAKRKEVTVTTISHRMKVTTGPMLVLASCAYLHFFKDLVEIPRIQILETMKQATGFFETNYSKNLSHAINTLMGQDKLKETKKGCYSLPHPTLIELEKFVD